MAFRLKMGVGWGGVGGGGRSREVILVISCIFLYFGLYLHFHISLFLNTTNLFPVPWNIGEPLGTHVKSFECVDPMRSCF